MKYTPGNYKSEHWTERAACGSAPECDKQALTGAFPTREIAVDLKRRYCDNCPVKVECLNWAYDDWAFTGVAGGVVFAGEKSSGKARRVIQIREIES